MREELNKSPWGRELHVLAHRLPRSCKRGHDWELERGFHLEIVGDSLFRFVLRARSEDATPTLPLFPESDSAGQEKFLIWHCPGRYQGTELTGFAEQLRSQYTGHVGLILTQCRERHPAMLDFAKYRGVWNEVAEPVVQVFQNVPDANYFAVEKSLFDLGRVGRRLLRLGKIRRLLPW